MPTIKTILAPIDLGDQASAGLDYAVDLAETLGARIYVLYAFELPIVGFPDGVVLPTAELATRITTTGQAALDRAIDRHAGRRVEMTPLLEQGDPREMIVEQAKRLGADLIVMGTHGRAGVARALIGSVAERVVRTATVPVLTVRAKHGDGK